MEEHFDDNLKLYEDFQHIPNVVDYIDAGWTCESVPWKRLWPRFGQLFAYGGMDTTNHIKHHWEWIKYTLLQGKVIHALRDLTIASIGSAMDGSRIGRPTLLNYFQTVQFINKYYFKT